MFLDKLWADIYKEKCRKRMYNNNFLNLSHVQELREVTIPYSQPKINDVHMCLWPHVIIFESSPWLLAPRYG